MRIAVVDCQAQRPYLALVGLWSRSRYVVATIEVAVDPKRAPWLLGSVAKAAERIVEAEGEFSVARDEIVRIAEDLLGADAAWTHAASWGEVFRKEEDAGRYGEESFARCAGRYLSSGDDGAREEIGTIPSDAEILEGQLVIMLTVATQGEAPAIEKSLASHRDVTEALEQIVALGRTDRLDLAHIHHAPARTDEALTEDQLLVSYPELVPL
jgi:hypothetical protein